MKRLLWLILFAVCAVTGMLLFMANIRLAMTEASLSSSSTRASSYNADAAVSTNTNRLFLHVENRTGLAEMLGWKLRRQLTDSGGFDVILLNNEPAADNVPLLLVGVRDQQTFWTPFYCGGTYRIVGIYSTYDAAIQLDRPESTTFNGDDAQGTLPLRIGLDIAVESSSTGFITLPAHRRILVDEAAEAIVAYLRESIDTVEAEAAEKAAE